MKRVTVFTPTYNRANSIHRVYESLCNQTYHDFEWLVIDDGSSDNTKNVIEAYKAEKKVEIRYFFQKNAGKHVAMNRAVKEATGELFIIADSDDEFLPKALEILVSEWDKIPDKKYYKGVTCRCFENSTDNIIGHSIENEPLDVNEMDAKFIYGLNFEMWGIMSTKVLKQYPFPEEKGLHFYPEIVVWGKIAQKYITRYINIPLRIYFRDQDDATTGKKAVNYRENYYLWSYMLNDNIKYFKYNKGLFIKAAVGFTRDCLLAKRKFHEEVSILKTIFAKVLVYLCYPVGYVLYYREK